MRAVPLGGAMGSQTEATQRTVEVEEEGGDDVGRLFTRRRRVQIARLMSAGLTRSLLAELSGFKQCPPTAVMQLWLAVLAGTGMGE